MRLVLLGNGPFGLPAFQELMTAGHEIVLVVARPDRPHGKHHHLVEPGPVACWALERELPLEQPMNANDPHFVAKLSCFHADLLVVADFGQILSPATLNASKLGGINIHASLLPKYRGAAPIVWAIYHGECETGVTIIQMSPRMDAGGMLLQQAMPIDQEITAGELELQLSKLGADLAVRAVALLERGAAQVTPQDNAQATKAPKLKKEDGRIDWTRPALAIHNQVRAMQPWPIAHAFLGPESKPIRMQILKTHARAGEAGTPGRIAAVDDAIVVETGSGLLAIHRLQPAGKRAMNAQEFLCGHKLTPGDRFLLI